VKVEQFVKSFVIPLEEYPHIEEDQSICKAIEQILLYKSGAKDQLLQFSELFVSNRDGQVVGKLTLSDILTALEPKLLKMDKKPVFEGAEMDAPSLAILWEDSFFKHCREHQAKTVKEFMSPIKSVISGSDPVLKALYIMLHSGEQSLPVLEDGKIVGVLRIEELFTITCGLCEI